MAPLLAAAAPAGGQPGAPGAGGLFGPMGYMVLLLGIMYFLLFRPQQQKAKQHRELINRLKAGDKVITNGGIHGVVTGVDETSVMLNIAEGVNIKIVKSAVGSVLDNNEDENEQTREKTTKKQRG